MPRAAPKTGSRRSRKQEEEESCSSSDNNNNSGDDGDDKEDEEEEKLTNYERAKQLQKNDTALTRQMARNKETLDDLDSPSDEGEEEEDDDDDDGDSSDDDDDDSSSDDDDDDSDDSGRDRHRRQKTTPDGGFTLMGGNKKVRNVKRGKMNSEFKITRQVHEILNDEARCVAVRKQLDSVLAQADLYAEFLRTQVEAAASEGGDGDDGATSEMLEPPAGCGLLAHQVYGVRWLTSVFENGINSILADEQGLGKTIEVIGFLARLFSERIVGPHIIVVPLSTIDNWRREFGKWAPKIRLLVLHGAKADYPPMFQRLATEFRPPYSNEEKMRYGTAAELSARCGGVILTSYEVAMRYCDDLNEMPRQWQSVCKEAYRRDVNHWNTVQQQQQQQQLPQMPEIDSDAVLLTRTYGVLVVDEAHRLKNFQCLLIQQLRALTCESRLLLTGTPMHNRLTELWSILHFIVPELFQSVVNFRVWFGVSDELVRTTCSFAAQLEKKAASSVLTAGAKSADDGASNNNNNGKDEIDDDEDGQQLMLLEGTKDEDFAALLKDAVSASAKSMNEKPKPTAKGKRGAAAAAVSSSSSSSSDDDDGGGDNNIKKSSKDGDDDDSGLPLSGKRDSSPSKPIEFTSMQQHTKVANQHIKQLGEAESVGVVAKMHRVLRPFMLRRTKNELPELKLPKKTEVLVRCPLSELQKRAYQQALCGKKYRNARLSYLRSACNHPYFVGNDAEFERYRDEIRRTKGDTLTFQGDMAQRRRYIDHLLTDSTKTNVLLNLLPALAQEGHVMLVFSQSTMLLETIAELLDAYALGQLSLGLGGVYTKDTVPLAYRRLQGGQQIDVRNQQLNEFLDDRFNVRVFLVSTRAGGVGLNLMRADTVIMMDCDYSPQNDLQAIDRVHRIGQLRPVVVYRLFCRDTVEEVILECCTHKLRLEGLVIGAGQYKGISAGTAVSSAAAAAASPTTTASSATTQQTAVQQLAALRRQEADAIKNALSRLRNMVLADFSIDKDKANKGDAVSSESVSAAGSPITAVEQQQQQQQQSSSVFNHDAELLSFVPSSVGSGGHYVFNVDEMDPTWGLDFLTTVGRT